jgi:hypothetical protein
MTPDGHGMSLIIILDESPDPAAHPKSVVEDGAFMTVRGRNREDHRAGSGSWRGLKEWFRQFRQTGLGPPALDRQGSDRCLALHFKASIRSLTRDGAFGRQTKRTACEAVRRRVTVPRVCSYLLF